MPTPQPALEAAGASSYRRTWGPRVGHTLPSAHPRGHKGGRLLGGGGRRESPCTSPSHTGHKTKRERPGPAVCHLHSTSPHQLPGQERARDTETPPWHTGKGQPGSRSWVSDQGCGQGARGTRTEIG